MKYILVLRNENNLKLYFLPQQKKDEHVPWVMRCGFYVATFLYSCFLRVLNKEQRERNPPHPSSHHTCNHRT